MFKKVKCRSGVVKNAMCELADYCIVDRLGWDSKLVSPIVGATNNVFLKPIISLVLYQLLDVVRSDKDITGKDGVR